MTIGSSFSAEDIASQTVTHGATKAIMSARKKTLDGHLWEQYIWPDEAQYTRKFVKKPMVSSASGKVLTFTDGTTEVVDTIIVSTVISKVH